MREAAHSITLLDINWLTDTVNQHKPEEPIMAYRKTVSKKRSKKSFKKGLSSHSKNSGYTNRGGGRL